MYQTMGNNIQTMYCCTVCARQWLQYNSSNNFLNSPNFNKAQTVQYIQHTLNSAWFEFKYFLLLVIYIMLHCFSLNYSFVNMCLCVQQLNMVTDVPGNHTLTIAKIEQ